MKKIYAQKKLFLFINFFSIFFLVIGLLGGIMIDTSMFGLLFFSLGLLLLSLLFLIKKIYYDETTIYFSFTRNKLKVKYDDIKEIFVEYDFISGAMVVLNLEKKTNSPCHKYADYAEICRKDNIKNTIFISGISKKDLDALLKGCSCKKKVISNATIG